MPFVVVERLPDILENGYNEIKTAKNIPQEDACLPEKRSSHTKKRKTSRSKLLTGVQKNATEKTSRTAVRTIDKIV